MEFVINEGLQAFCDKHGKKKKTRAPRKKGAASISDHEDSYLEDDWFVCYITKNCAQPLDLKDQGVFNQLITNNHGVLNQLQTIMEYSE